MIPSPQFQGHDTLYSRTFQKGAIVQLQRIHLLNLHCNVPLMCGPSALAEPLVSLVVIVDISP